ncbi:hypothetical protein [Moritella sp.]|uniref:hypothetical protein n=1 Tax=Moritella sp. TaxID=78556 RepID=UPI001DF76B65|nr:hypothetical protein [Moritella sp.]MCJ8348029.1 hypothetical protein [Moritella sp.]NQZ40298.1 hypothetical protein [Moritella sp.]
MRYLPLIIFICLLSQGCSTKSNLPINRPTSTIQALALATIEDAKEDQPISVDGLDKLQIDASDVVDESVKQLEDPSGEMKNMSDTIDFMPKPRSYWM